MELKDYFNNGKVRVWEGNFAVLKSKKILKNAFAVIQDKKEITIVIDQAKTGDSKGIIDIEKDWKILTFDMVLPFELTGFLAEVAKALAEEVISIFVISSYSTDHVLVKESQLTKTIKKLEKLGFKITK